MSNDHKYVAQTNMAASMVDGEAVVLNLQDGKYYGLNTLAAELWRYLHEPKTINDMVGLITTKYDVNAETARQDVLRLLRDLEARDLIKEVP